ncbi:MAG: substrate-binding domain-containing protein [Gammaproteobacteria bacterium]|nr:substrate-binding domain-containing protein [Gammaproteobacteria bacterium]
MRRFGTILLLSVVVVLAQAGLANAEQHPIRLATTTSTENSGLLRALLPPFEQQTGYTVHVIAVGTGKALRMARDGNVDVVMVHAPKAERAFVEVGHGVNRRDLMYNDFIIVGPADDPAHIHGVADAAAALSRVATARSLFVSRGDDSGTHKKESALWAAANVTPAAPWYREVGQGMGRTLQIASELAGYTLADRGTWLAMRDKLSLQVLVEGDTRLFNPYGIIAVNPARYPDINYPGAMALIAWLTSVDGQAIVRNFEIDGQPLFKPLAVKVETSIAID